MAAGKVFDLTRRHYPPMPDKAGDGGAFFEHRAGALAPGDYVLRCQLQLDARAFARPGTLRILCATLAGREIAELAVPLSPQLMTTADHLYLRFNLARPARLVMSGHVSAGLGHVHLRRLQLHAGAEDVTDAGRGERTIRGLMIGTTGQCNASCPSCPTNKTLRDRIPSGVMPMTLFRRIVDEIAEGGFVLAKRKLGLGLFGEPLMDPHIVERVKYVRKRLPRMRVLLNTNMGPFNERRHGELASLVHRFSVHVEALSPDLYAELMAPLRSEIVFPKIERLLALAPGKVNIAVPLSTRNEHDFAASRAHWMAKGARNVCDLALSNRTTDDLDYFEKSLGPAPMACGEAVRDDLVIDWDGTVLACCQDFLRREPLGNINQSSIAQILAADARRRFASRLKDGCWNALQSCRHCKMDPKGQTHGSDED